MIIVGFWGTVLYSGCKYITGTSKVDLESLGFYKDLIAEIAETIIPATDTPGAKRAKVEDYIIKAILEHENSRTQNTFLTGLRDLQDYTKKKYYKTFQNCSTPEKNAVLGYFEHKETSSEFMHKLEIKLFGGSFFSKIRELTVYGFCTSKIGATEALAYDPVPVYYLACIPLKNGQKSWATH